MKLSSLHKVQILCISFCLVISLWSANHYRQQEDQRRKIEQMEKPTLATKTNTSPALATMDQISKRLKLFPSLYMSSIYFYQTVKDSGTYVIPGLKATHTLKNGKKDMCTVMTPQGLCVVDQYILVSAYCHNRNHNSVIYVLNKNTHEFVKEIILPGKPHAGGLAYDPKRKEIWVTSKIASVPELCIFTLDQVEEFDSKDNKPIQYKYRYSVPTLSNASYMTYFDDHIYVGSFAFTEKDSKLQIFSLRHTKNAKYREDGRYFILEKSIHTMDKVQGITFDDTYMYFSRSDGPYQNSKLELYEKNERNLVDTYPLFSYNFPERMEQIFMEEDKMYILFESAANGYNRIGLNFIDRILLVNRDELLSN